MVLHHPALAGVHGLRILDKGVEPLGTAALHHLGEFGGVVGPLPQKGMATHAVILVPDGFSTNDRIGELVFMGALGNLLKGIRGEPQEDP